MTRTPTGVRPVPSGSRPASLVRSGLHAAISTPTPVFPEFPRLGRYQLLSRLAVGGMAEVYLARYGELTGFKTLVVVKKVLPHLAVKPDFIAMFLDEARIASMLDHPNVVRINEVGKTDQEYFLAMELVQGKPLASLLQHVEKSHEPLPHRLAALIVANAAAGLHYAHQLTDASGELLGLVHRDVSPQNIMLSFEGSVKVIDFGIARALGRLNDTNSGSLKGKLGYMAPEQARGEPTDARADIFSLGVVLWESLVGRRLFLHENEMATLRAVVYDPIPSVSSFVQVDPALEAITVRSLDRNTLDRYQSAEEMRIDLERWIFASGGTSTHELAALMKGWFPGDYSQWQRAARIALDMQETDSPIDVAFPDLQPSLSGISKTGNSNWEITSRRPGTRDAPTSDGFLRFLPKSKSIRIAGAAAFVVLVIGLVALLAFRKDSSLVQQSDKRLIAPVRPTVQTLPAAGTLLDRSGSPDKPGLEDITTHKSETPTGQAVERTGSDEGATGQKNRAQGSEKRAILPGRTKSHRPMGARPNPFEKAPSNGKSKVVRPNPF